MRHIVKGLERIEDPNLLVGFSTADDAGVYLLRGETALVQSVDFITPVVDDPAVFGQVAAANALSDIYAMGGQPITALNICCFPAKGIDREQLREILRGGSEKVRESKACLVGGHTVQDPELKYGLSVTGLVDRERLIRNSSARAGDLLVLTKPIGTGAIISAFRNRSVSDATLTEAIAEMTRLNATASALMLQHEAHACTDITGFGLLGHALEMAEASGVGLRFRPPAIPYYEESLSLIRKGAGTAVTRCNLEMLVGKLTITGKLDEEKLTLLADPQTSGGLLVSLPESRAEEFVNLLHTKGDLRAAIVGEVFSSEGPRIEISL